MKTARQKKAKILTIADLLSSDYDFEKDAGRHTSVVVVAAKSVGMLLDMIQEAVMEFKSKLTTGMMRAPILQMDDAIIQKTSDQLPLRRWSAITSAVCNRYYYAFYDPLSVCTRLR